jgi:hypothetical protein
LIQIGLIDSISLCVSYVQRSEETDSEGIMLKIIAALIVLVSSISFASPFITTTAINLRVRPNTHAHVVSVIPRRVRVDARNCSRSWCRVTYRNRTGYANRRYLRLSSAPQPRARPLRKTPSSGYYTNVDGQRVQRPVFTDSAPSGASALCRDGSYSFSQHRRGTCSHHGGVSMWLASR